MTACTHLDQIEDVEPTSEGCNDCIVLGDTWVHLRMCMTCGKVGCCEDSKNKHALQHFHETGHPIINSQELGESWGWCYEDEIFLDLLAI